MNYIIGVDGGGTKTEAVAYSLADEKLGEGRSGFGNILLDFNQALINIISSIEQCKGSVDNKSDQWKCLSIYLGLAGIETANNIKKIETILREKFNCEVKVSNDAYIAHAALLKGEDGIITISGTGSISYGIYKGKRAVSGGWGHILGDEGSGYFIALEAFKRMAVEEDSGWIKSKLTRTIMNKLNLDKVDNMKEFIYSANKSEISEYALLVVKLANGLEVNSVNILKNAGKNLAIMTERLYNKLGINEPIKIGIKGSILTEVRIVREEFKSYLEINLVGVTIIEKDVSSTKGACYLHKH